MRHLWEIFQFEFVHQFRRRAYLFTTFILPVLVVGGLLGVQAFLNYQASRERESGGEAQTEETFTGKLGYVDHSGLFESPGLFGSMLIRYPDEDSALDAMRAGEVASVYVIAADYLDTGNVTRYIRSVSINSMQGDSFFQAFLMDRLLQGMDRDLALRLRSDIVIVEHQVAASGEAAVARSEDSSFVLVYVFALLLAIAIFFSGGYLMSSVIYEKESRMMEIILSSVRPLPLLAGKVLASGLLGLIQIVVWGIVAVYGLRQLGAIIPSLSDLAVAPEMLVWVLLYFIGGFLLFAGAYAAVGAIAPSMREGPQMAVVFTLPAMLPYYFLAIFAETPNAALPVVLSLFPVTAPVGMVMRLMVTTVPLWQLLLGLALLLLAGFGAIWLAGRLFRVQVLLAGHLPRWRDIPQLVRER